MKRINHLYVHVPFCKTICHYCDFCHRVYHQNTVKQWLETIKKEIIDKCKDQYKTIYIGGGTPTSLTNNELIQLLSMIKPYTNEVIEYTIEVNPDSLDLDKILILKEFGINRVSMGVQSSNDDLLKYINRKHTFKDAKDKIQLLKDNGIHNISIDLMYGLPNQDINILKETLTDFLSLDIPHVSLYSLTIEENTVFSKQGIKQIDNDLEADMYELITDTLEKNGYTRYEVSNFSKKGYESLHNLGYWGYHDFLGISLGASSKIGNIRYTNTRNFNDYFNDYNHYEEYLELTYEDQKFENIMMSLRTIYGLDIYTFNLKYHCDILKDYPKAIQNPNIIIDNNRMYCNNLAILNNVLLDFMN